MRYLTSGGMSLIYKGEKGGETVVLKEVAASNTREVPSLLSEKTLLERLDHPGLVGFRTFFTENNHYYLVVDYVPGEPLSSQLQRTPLPSVEEVIDWAVQLCEIFTYLHAQKPPIIYRDLKAENVVLHDGKLTLIDFGIARLHKGDRASDTELMGSPVTASPEHYGGAETDARSDIYTLGATVYELLTGGRRQQIGAFAFASVRKLRPEVPETVDEVLMRSLAFRPDERYQTAREFRDALLQAVGRPLPAPENATVGVPPSTPGHDEPRSTPVAEPGRLHRETRTTERTEGTPPHATPPSHSQATLPQRKRLSWLVALGLLLALGAGAVKSFGGAGHPPGAVPSMGTLEANLDGKLFGSGKVGEATVVFMGEDVGLFQVTATATQTVQERANHLANRLNISYKAACPSCGGTGLEPADIKVGRYAETGDTVVFYAHMHGHDELEWGPELLATVGSEQAKALNTTPSFLASYWRDLLRDIIMLSRGFAVDDSALGVELSTALLKARSELKGEDSTVANLRRILRETTGAQAARLREIYTRVPERRPSVDVFGGVPGYEPLRN